MKLTKKVILTTAISTALIATAGCSSNDNYELLSMKSDSNKVNTTAARPAMMSVKVDKEPSIEPESAPQSVPEAAPEIIAVTESIEKTLVINFNFDSSELTSESKQQIDNMLNTLPDKSSELELTLSGHTDAIGTNEYNRALSKERAQSVRDYLVMSGFTEADFDIDAYGERRPVATNETEMGREENRRVRIELDGTKREFAVIY